MSARHLLGVLAAGLVFAGPAVAAPVVETMVVGPGGTLLGSRRVTAAPSSVRVAGRRCAVAGATPLAVLLAVTRSIHAALGLRDYGHCDADAADSGQLFVNSLDGYDNSGQDGWEYKVGRVSGTTGAADTSGALGNGRLLASGQRVLWFWCRASAGGCQRTLAVTAAGSSVSGRAAAGGALAVSVSGYDNNGHRVPVAAASLSFGSSTALTGSGGRATLAVPTKPGRYALSASKPGLVPSFPETIVVR